MYSKNVVQDKVGLHRFILFPDTLGISIYTVKILVRSDPKELIIKTKVKILLKSMTCNITFEAGNNRLINAKLIFQQKFILQGVSCLRTFPSLIPILPPVPPIALWLVSLRHRENTWRCWEQSEQGRVTVTYKVSRSFGVGQISKDISNDITQCRKAHTGRPNAHWESHVLRWEAVWQAQWRENIKRSLD